MQPRAPRDQGVAAAIRPPVGRCGAGPVRAWRSAGRRCGGIGPGEHAGQHDAASCRPRCAQGDAAEVQAVVGDRQAVAHWRYQQVRTRHAEVVEDDAVVVGVLQGVQAVVHELEVLVFFGGRSTISTAGLPCSITTRPIVRPGTTLVMNSFSPLTRSRRRLDSGGAQAVRSVPAPGSVRAKPESRAAGEPRQELSLLLGIAEGAHRIDGADAAVDRRQPGDGGIEGRHAA